MSHDHLLADLDPALRELAELAVARLLGGLPAALPRRVEAGVRWYLLAPKGASVRAVRDEFLAHLGNAHADDRGTIRSLDVDQWEVAAAVVVDDATCTVSLSVGDLGHQRARTLMAFWARRDGRPRLMPASLPALLQRLDNAISAGSRRDVDDALGGILSHPDATSDNRAFSRVRAYAGTGRYHEVLEIGDLGDLVYLPLPATVREDILVSLFECVATGEDEAAVDAAIASAPQTVRLARAIVASPGIRDPRALAVISAFSAGSTDPDQDTAPSLLEAVRSVDPRDREAVADVLADVVQVGDQRSASALVELLPQDEVPPVLALVASQPTSLKEWAARLAAEPELALPDDLRLSDSIAAALECDGGETVSLVCEALLDGAPDRSAAWRALPSLAAALTDRDRTRSHELGACAVRLLEAVCVRDIPDAPARDAVSALLDAALLHEANGYGEMVDGVSSFVRSAATLQTMDWLSDLIEQVASAPVMDRPAVTRLLDDVLERTTTFAFGLAPETAALLARSAAVLLGAEHGAAFVAAVSVTGLAIDTEADDRIWGALGGEVVAVYSLDPGQLNGLAQWLKERSPTADIRRHAEETASAQLSAVARAALLMVVSIAASKHAATNAIEEARPATRRDLPHTVRLNRRGSAYGRRIVTEAVRDIAARL